MYKNFTLQNIATNGISLRVAVEGTGPLIILVHGWPEIWYSWRHQIKPLAAAGYRVVVPDVRGYGGSDKPHAVKAYDMASMMADIIGIIDHFGEEQAILMGHDWGAPICWNTAALFPDRIKAIAGLSVPYSKRIAISFPALWEKLFADRFFYMRYFQKEGVAEAEFERDIGQTLRKIYYALSGNVASPKSWYDRPKDSDLLTGLTDPDPFPNWMTPEDLLYVQAAFEISGFRGPLNRYRNQDRDHEDLPEMGVPPIEQPSCFIAGSVDSVRFMIPERDGFAAAGDHCNDFRFCEIIDGKGHWIQQEAPDEVNAALLKFLDMLN